jgi:hypothetical protein
MRIDHEFQMSEFRHCPRCGHSTRFMRKRAVRPEGRLTWLMRLQFWLWEFAHSEWECMYCPDRERIEATRYTDLDLDFDLPESPTAAINRSRIA